ncbi:hypothetical protein [Litchfieldia salsa]|uniref:Uncharacterized protein n=1 Tax=Litchfieldia salsa TaxID=930152 RepID=A0A1H0VPU6_9BACI|nr:hypothetical protein [Litchfieldia salsa]SDP80364.1 hypothetical protein SAMN05216565_107126 [Litchfieldia salsa]
MTRKLTIEDVQKVAISRGGKCLSIEYINSRTHLQFRCSEGHTFPKTPAKLNTGQWCPVCVGNKKKTIWDMHSIANKHGGVCLSVEYVNNNSDLKWKCKVGHTFDGSYISVQNSIKNGGFCSKCNIIRRTDKRKLKIEDLQDLARLKAGELISDSYINAHTELSWKCVDGHTFYMNANDVKNGHWCRECSKTFNLGEEKCRYVLEHFTNKVFKSSKQVIEGFELDGYNQELKLAFEYNGIQHYKTNGFFIKTKEELDKRKKDDKHKEHLCLEKEIHLIKVPYSINTDKDILSFLKNELEQQGIDIINDISTISSPNFYKNYMSALKELREIANERGGSCIATEYRGSKGKIEFVCSNGHLFTKRPNDLKNGQWCGDCYLESRSHRFN